MIVYDIVLTAAGNSTHPNIFSYNLLKNLGDLQGSYPVIRVGGNTQYEQAKSDIQTLISQGLCDIQSLSARTADRFL